MPSVADQWTSLAVKNIWSASFNSVWITEKWDNQLLQNGDGI